MEAGLKALKVAELKKILTDNGLDDKGKKEELVARLVQAGIGADGKKAASAPAPAAAPAAKPAPTPAAAPAAAKPAAAPAAAAAPAPAAAAPAAKAAETPAADSETAASATSAEMTELEKKKARAAKFGIPFEEDAEEKKKARAAKFGTGVDDSKVKSREERFKNELAAVGSKQGRPAAEPMSAEELERLKKRAERFGVPMETPKPGKEGKKPAAKEEPKTTDPKLLAREARFAAQAASS